MKYVESITVYPSNKTIQMGKWYYGATATVCPCDADKPSVCWYSDNESVAAVNPTTGYIYGVSLGTARIYARACDGSGVEGCMTVTVSETIPVESVSLNYGYLSIEKGTSVTLTTFIYPEDATNKSLTWCSSNESVARVANGVVCGIGKGTATITATTTNGKSTSCIVTVTENILVTSIVIEPLEDEVMAEGESVFLEATVYPTNATNKNLRWRSEDTSIVTVNEYSGLAMAQKIGTTVVYATATDGSGVESYYTIEVVPAIPVECVCVLPKTTVIGIGEARDKQENYLYADVVPYWATNASLAWESSNTNVATVERLTIGNDINGVSALVTGISKGTATITAMATDGSGKKSSCTVTVDPREKVTVEKDSTGIYGRIVFNDGKVWNCINRDIINDYNLDMNDAFSQRFYDNAYQTKVIDEGQVYYYEPMKEYTDDEIKLIYTIDPYGLAAYVKEFAENNYETGCSEQEMLGGILEYKDYIFELLYKRTPQYYARNSAGNWFVTTNKSDLKAVVSESEYLFGFHALWDTNSIYQILSTALDLLVSVTGADNTKLGDWITKIAKVALNLWAGKAPFNLQDIAEFIVDDDVKDEINDEIGSWATYISLMQSLGELQEIFSDRPQLYSTMLGFSSDNNQDINYNIVFKLANGQRYFSRELYDLI